VAWFISRKALAGLLVLEEGEKLTRPKLVEKKQQLFFSDSSYETREEEEKKMRVEAASAPFVGLLLPLS
jgi:hypothetical protein